MAGKAWGLCFAHVNLKKICQRLTNLYSQMFNVLIPRPSTNACSQVHMKSLLKISALNIPYYFMHDSTPKSTMVSCARWGTIRCHRRECLVPLRILLSPVFLNIQGQAGQCSEQLHLVEDVPAHCRGGWTRRPL